MFDIDSDPDCFVIGDTCYAISGGVKPPVFKSKVLEIGKLKPTNEGFREAQKNRLWLPSEGK